MTNHRRCLLASLALALAALISGPTAISAQEKKPPICDIKMARIGFMGNEIGDSAGRYKIGMWTPVYLKIKAGPQGIRRRAANEPLPYIQVENEDSDDVGTIYRTPFEMDPNEERWVMTYARPGKMSDIRVRVFIGDLAPFNPPPYGSSSLELNSHLYVSLGDRIPDLHKALAAMSPRRNQNFGPGQSDTWPRSSGFETDVNQLPDNWFGYQAVDLLFLSTRDKDFLLELVKNSDASRARLRALAQYVRRGGRLVVSILPRHADVLAQLLESTVWQPPLPVVPPREGAYDVKQLVGAEGFFDQANVQPFGPLRVAQLEPAKMVAGSWEVLMRQPDPKNLTAGKPLLTRMPYGLGSISFLAFPLDEAPFTTWNGREKFLTQLLMKLAPRVNPNAEQQDPRGGRGDLSTELQRTLDNFDVRVIPFGYVALFIVLYIIVVGPLDFILLKYVFKRLEWTWFTFPTVVLAVSVAAYYTAYAIKGNDLKINKVDVIDIDQRTGADAKGQVKKATACGQTFFTILSPQIKNYTIGVEPNPLFWGQNGEQPASADMVTWLGRAEFDDFRGMGRGGGQGFFRKPYHYEADAVGLRDVPIPVWTTKAFQASWEVPGVSPPLQTSLMYVNEAGRDLRIRGTIKSGLGVDLEDTWLFYSNMAFPIEGGLPKGTEIKLELQHAQGRRISEWPGGAKDGNRVQTSQGPYNPGPMVRQAQFNEGTDVNVNTRNHALRSLDLSWRLRDERDAPGIREAILVGRVRFGHGSAEDMAGDANSPLPTNVWLDAIPGAGKTRPRLAGILAQDTFVRVILAIKPKE